MDPFRLSCPHCASKVVVRHVHLLGQTLPCPKCKGLISVPITPDVESTPINSSPTTSRPERPVDFKSTGQRIVNSGAITKATDEDWEAVLASENLAQAIAQETAQGASFREQTGSRNAAVTSPPVAIPLDSISVNSPIHTHTWQTKSAAKRRQVMMLTTIAATGSVLAIICFISFVRWAGSPSESTFPNGDDVAVEDPSLKVRVADGPNANAVDEVPAPTTAASDSNPKPNALQSIEPSEIVVIDAPETNTLPTSDTANATASTNNNNANPNLRPGEVAITPAVPNETGAQSKTDKLALNSDLDMKEIFPQDFLGGLLNTTRKPDSVLKSEQSKDELNIENATVDLGSVYHPPARATPTWQDRSKIKIPSFKMNDLSLLRCIDWFSRTTAVGITLDWQSCRIAGIDVSKKVSLVAEGKTIEELIDAIAKENGLVLSLDKQGLPILQATQASMDSHLPREWKVDGLFPNGSEQNGCDLLLQMWNCDAKCSYENGNLRWSDEATSIDKANVLASLLELAQLNRVAAIGLSIDGETPLALFSPSLWHGGANKLSTKIRKSATIPESRPIPDLLMIAAAESKLELIIDWQHAWGHGLVPDELAISFLPGRTPAQIASRFMTTYALELVPISDSWFSLTTGDVRRKSIRIIPLRIPNNMKADNLKQSLFALAPLGPDDRNAFLFKELPGSQDIVLVRICAPRADQLNDPNLIQSFGWE